MNENEPTSDIRSVNNCRFEPAESVWVFGKGPSLESFDFSTVSGPSICINESLLLVENPTYFFAHDNKPIKNVANHFPENCIAILEPQRAEYAASQGIPAHQIITYLKHDISGDFGFDSESLLQDGKLVGCSGTVHSAIHFCKYLGAKTVNMIGFEGTGPYAPSLEMEIPVGGGRHDRIRADSKRLLDYLGFQFRFFDNIEADSSNSLETIDYGRLYDELRKNGYHEKEDQTSHIVEHIPWLQNNLEFENVLDIGCSTGASLDEFSHLGYEATGVEISSLAVENGIRQGRNVIQGCATDLPFEDSSFDLVVSADVFEHLKPEDGIDACREACRVARKFVFLKIAEHEDATKRWKELAGHPLHLTTKPIDWWKNHLKEFGRIRRLERELICVELELTLLIESESYVTIDSLS